MSDWSNGYVTEVDYTYDYYRELNPNTSRLALLNAGFAPLPDGPAIACELGFGFGVSTNIHAAASGDQWWGTDFNPSQAGFARDLAKASGADAHLFDQSFAEFCHRDDLPEFDFIGLHGIWSWVSDENRRLIVDFVRRRLRVGGVLYVSYNTQPGWAQMVPLRQLLLEHAETMSAPGIGVNGRIESALEQISALIDASPGYAALNPSAASRIKKLKEQNRNYLAHEYFNRDWQPMLFSEFARSMEPAKVSFCCSAMYSDHWEDFNLLPQQVALLNGIPDMNFRQSARDFMVNRQFRKDYWVKGPRRMDAAERLNALRSQQVILSIEREDVVLKAGGSLVERELPREIYEPVIDCLTDRKACSLGEIESRLEGRNISFQQILEAVMILAGKGDLALARSPESVKSAAKSADKFNKALIEGSFGAGKVNVLASPVTGGGVYVQPFHVQMLRARQSGLDTPQRWAESIAQNLAENGAGIVKPGGGMMSSEEAVAALAAEAKTFSAKRLPHLKALKVIS